MTGGERVLGLHHVTAIAGEPQANVDFYTGVLGLRLVKQTVNFDDPGTYHLYFGNALGSPGTIMTFFPWPGAPRGRRGTGQATVTAFSIAEASLGYWRQRLAAHGVTVTAATERFEEAAIGFHDPDGLELELVARDGSDDREPWGGGSVPAEHAIRGFYAVTLTERMAETTARFLTERMGFRPVAEHDTRFRFDTADGGTGARVDVLDAPGARAGVVAAGTVHHVAWRVAGDREQRAWRAALAAQGVAVTPVLDRTYFHSIYYREPGGVLFELATDPPGFTIDEPADALGSALRLPSWLENHRARIEEALPALRVPAATHG